MLNAVDGDAFTIETVVCPLDFNANCYQFFGSSGISIYTVSANDAFSWVRMNSCVFNLSSLSKVGTKLALTTKLHDNKYVNRYIDGSWVQGTGVTRYAMVDSMKIDGKCAIYAIRLYSRALTQEEI